MLRHSTGYKLANDGHDTRALQHYLGHKNTQNTERNTELSAARFNGSWEDQRATRVTNGGHSPSGQLSHQSSLPTLSGTSRSSGP